jgi:hypothetical protein
VAANCPKFNLSSADKMQVEGRTALFHDGLMIVLKREMDMMIEGDGGQGWGLSTDEEGDCDCDCGLTQRDSTNLLMDYS